MLIAIRVGFLSANGFYRLEKSVEVAGHVHFKALFVSSKSTCLGFILVGQY